MHTLLIALAAGLLLSLGLVPPAGATLTQQKAAAQAPFPGLKTWNLLIMSEPSNAGVGAAYAKLIEQDQHVKVRLHDCWIDDSMVRQWLDRIRSNADVVPYIASAGCTGKWQDQIRAAEVIVVSGGPVGSEPANGAWNGSNSWLMFPFATWRDYTGNPAKLAQYRAAITKSCAPQTFARFKADLGTLYDTILKLRGKQRIIMRATDFYMPTWAGVQEVRLRDVCRHCLENSAAAVHQASKTHGVPVGSSFDALDGKDHRSDATKLGYIGPSGTLLSPKGAQRVAEALRQTGYGYAGR